MPRQRQRSTQARAGIHFIIADPSSSRERPDNLRIVRSHVGRWRWQQAKQNLQGESQQDNGADNVIAAKHSHDDGSLEPDMNEILADALAGDLGTDTDRFPSLVSESVVPDKGSNHWHNSPDHDYFASSDQEWNGTAPPEIWWNEQNAAIDTGFGSSVCLGGISPNILDPFQIIETSPLPASLVSNANKYCAFQPAPILSVLQLTLHPQLCQYCGRV